ncbi:phage holin family protein [Chroogloeocystis siderophila]|jgi:putative membrane protein|uniref:Phage holin family protein n=1 Tax=Chroogloeocystis siderophila 5.2 s.c.1 TaxID=247279 RepID=A0A1U7HIE6_9CHRO|nr:phage holin family protein [Chroogloeocystis siderophila]OKH23366.1 hypothetical protein NIES1031_18105 [Chroogloeocystis siderophila 5.2 s.c.1]
MLQFVLIWVLSAIALVITAYIVPGFAVTSFASALLAAVILGLLNAIAKPILVLLTLPLTVVTLGLFLFIINALVIWLAGAITPGFVVTGFFPALLGSIVLTLVTSLLTFLVGSVRR